MLEVALCLRIDEEGSKRIHLANLSWVYLLDYLTLWTAIAMPDLAFALTAHYARAD
jgi:hypothetical protein